MTPTTSLSPYLDATLRGSALPTLIRDELLSEMFEQSAARWPDKTCMFTLGCSISYAQARERATAIARGLIREGVGPGHVVGLWGARGPDLLIAQLGIAKTGAAWLAFDAAAPIERVAVCLADSGARALIADKDRIALAEGKVDCEVVGVSDLIDLSDTTAVDARAMGASPQDPAYVIYTSGSTGHPKGIVISQRNICHLLRAVNEIYRIGRDDIMFQGASLAFDLSLEEIWVPYLVGASLFVATPEMMGDIDALPDHMEAAGVTVLDTVPTLLALLPRDVATVRVVILGGEVCPIALVERWDKPGRSIFNTYGPTETTVVATAVQLNKARRVTIGKPIPNYTCRVVNDLLEPVAPGVVGELLIGGPGVSRGYLGRSQLTAEQFIVNPFCDHGVDPVLYRSGDAVRITAGGEIEFHGRIDDQVKIRGFRIELGEIEAKLCEMPGITNAAVLIRNSGEVDELVAFVVGRADLDARQVRAALRLTLPAYMTPTRYQRIVELPRMASGKIDRNALRKMPLTTTLDT
jgi:amino acid adenylation domain-containing protein